MRDIIRKKRANYERSIDQNIPYKLPELFGFQREAVKINSKAEEETKVKFKDMIITFNQFYSDGGRK